MKPIGGYFSLELPRHEEYHKNAIRLSTGRNCLEYILRTRGYKKVYLPYYTCDVVMEPFNKLGISYEYYHIDTDFEIRDRITLKDGEALLYTNYFGLKQLYVEWLAKIFGQQLIVDSTQAFFAEPVASIDTFYTCRKFFGVPDGAYLYTDQLLNEDLTQDVSWERMSFLTKRIDLGAEVGYADFKALSRSLAGQPIKRMSNLTERLMTSIDIQTAAKQRRENYVYLHKYLADNNGLLLPLAADAVPMVYPYLPSNQELKKRFIAEKVFVATYWPNVMEWCKPGDWEYQLASNTIYLPIDQRYGEEEMRRLVSIIEDESRS